MKDDTKLHRYVNVIEKTEDNFGQHVENVSPRLNEISR